ncbi:cobalamin synthase [Pyrococcus sp. NA2]|uniref:adenosylcobinamide-GDP ribazoletransferase n=1 Tax=Pyrococcus sp. (strain NA2) TaxID=342949 RepID=UPI000209A99A|nr:adenosylcobinamide-GDP ribazoletransferase [Pyrococcus sp. NA2]AEC51912.1 cobalamin synthase [Pyrococcus sp. NA2]
MRNLLSFLTRIPVRGDFERVREELWVFPLVSVVTSLPPMVILYFGIPLANLLALLTLYSIIGLLHLDGLADWADGVMVKGPREVKVKAMKDVNTGIAGVFAVTAVILIQLHSLSLAPFYSIFLAELNSKFAMLLGIGTRKPLGRGLGYYFMEGMNGRQLVYGTVLYLVLYAIPILYDPRAILGILGIIPGVYAIKISLENFGGINGDCLGAIAEITRAGTLLIIAVILNL